MLITYSDDIVESLGVLKLLDVASTGTVLDSNVEYTRTQDFGCCQEDKVPVVAIDEHPENSVLFPHEG